MTDTHPITPPPELVKQWRNSWHHVRGEFGMYIATQAACWGADQELEACCAWLQDPGLNVDTYKLRADRRPKSPSLAQRALHILGSYGDLSPKEHDTIRKALEKLND